MGDLAEVLDGFEAELELERELGTRVVEIDRSLLQSVVRDSCFVIGAPSPEPRAPSPEPRTTSHEPRATNHEPRTTSPEPRTTSHEPRTTNPEPRATNHEPRTTNHDFVFLHHKMLSPGGIEMMAKIVTAMKKTPETAPIVFTGERPKAKVYVVLGGKAMNMWFPELRCSPGQWAKGPKGEEVLVTYSPEYILRFGTVTPAVQKIKMDMWTSLKGVLKKI